jgi:hypothetical protein
MRVENNPALPNAKDLPFSDSDRFSPNARNFFALV